MKYALVLACVMVLAYVAAAEEPSRVDFCTIGMKELSNTDRIERARKKIEQEKVPKVKEDKSCCQSAPVMRIEYAPPVYQPIYSAPMIFQAPSRPMYSMPQVYQSQPVMSAPQAYMAPSFQGGSIMGGGSPLIGGGGSPVMGGGFIQGGGGAACPT